MQLKKKPLERLIDKTIYLILDTKLIILLVIIAFFYENNDVMNWMNNISDKIISMLDKPVGIYAGLFFAIVTLILILI